MCGESRINDIQQGCTALIGRDKEINFSFLSWSCRARAKRKDAAQGCTQERGMGIEAQGIAKKNNDKWGGVGLGRSHVPLAFVM